MRGALTDQAWEAGPHACRCFPAAWPGSLLALMVRLDRDVGKLASAEKIGAGDGDRTRDIRLGKREDAEK